MQLKLMYKICEPGLHCFGLWITCEKQQNTKLWKKSKYKNSGSGLWKANFEIVSDCWLITRLPPGTAQPWPHNPNTNIGETKRNKRKLEQFQDRNRWKLKVQFNFGHFESRGHFDHFWLLWLFYQRGNFVQYWNSFNLRFQQQKPSLRG